MKGRKTRLKCVCKIATIQQYFLMEFWKMKKKNNFCKNCENNQIKSTKNIFFFPLEQRNNSIQLSSYSLEIQLLCTAIHKFLQTIFHLRFITEQLLLGEILALSFLFRQADFESRCRNKCFSFVFNMPEACVMDIFRQIL